MILLTLDASPSSEVAIDTAVDLAIRFQQPIHVLVVLDGVLRHEFAEAARRDQITPDEAVQRYLDGLVERVRSAGAPSAEGSFRHGVEAGPVIASVAAERGAVLVVMATHGRTGLTRFLAGSVTEHVIRASTVPVVVVPVGERRPASTD